MIESKSSVVEFQAQTVPMTSLRNVPFPPASTALYHPKPSKDCTHACTVGHYRCPISVARARCEDNNPNYNTFLSLYTRVVLVGRTINTSIAIADRPTHYSEGGRTCGHNNPTNNTSLSRTTNLIQSSNDDPMIHVSMVSCVC